MGESLIEPTERNTSVKTDSAFMLPVYVAKNVIQYHLQDFRHKHNILFERNEYFYSVKTH